MRPQMADTTDKAYSYAKILSIGVRISNTAVYGFSMNCRHGIVPLPNGTSYDSIQTE